MSSENLLIEKIRTVLNENKVSPDIQNLNKYYYLMYDDIMSKYGAREVLDIISQLFNKYLGVNPKNIDVFLQKYFGINHHLTYITIKLIDRLLIVPLKDDIASILEKRNNEYNKNIDTQLENLSEKISSNLFDLTNINNRDCFSGTFLLTTGIPGLVTEIKNRLLSNGMERSDKEIVLQMVSGLLKTTKSVFENVYNQEFVKDIALAKLKSPIVHGLVNHIRNVSTIPFPDLEQKYENIEYPMARTFKVIAYQGMLKSIGDPMGLFEEDFSSVDERFNYICEKQILDLQKSINEFSEGVTTTSRIYKEGILSDLHDAKNVSVNTAVTISYGLIIVMILLFLVMIYKRVLTPCVQRTKKLLTRKNNV